MRNDTSEMRATIGNGVRGGSTVDKYIAELKPTEATAGIYWLRAKLAGKEMNKRVLIVPF